MTPNLIPQLIATGDNNAIYAVTVFTNQAYIKRRVTALAETGLNRFLIEVNAFTIDADSVQADVYGNGEIISVQYKEVPVLDTDINQTEIIALKTEQRQLEDRLKELEYGLKNCLKQRTFLDMVTNPNGKKGTEDAATAPRSAQDLKEMLQNLKEMLELVSINYAETFAQELKIVREQQQINEQLALINNKFKSIPILLPTHKTIEVLFNAVNAIEIKIEVSYITANASWQPFYKVDLNRDLSAIHATMFAHIEQNTGENWHGVNLSVSNALPINGMKLPELYSWQLTTSSPLPPNSTKKLNLLHTIKLKPRLETETVSCISDFSPSDIEEGQQETGEVDPITEVDVYIAYERYQQAETLLRQLLEKEPNRKDLQAKLIEVAQLKLQPQSAKASTPAKFTQAQQIKSELTFEYNLPATNDISSGNGENLLPLFTKEMPHQFFYYAIPKQDAQVYWVCQADVDSELLPGRLNIHIGGRFVGHTLLDEKQAGRELLINLGPVRDVKIRREPITDQISERMLQGMVERRDVLRKIELRIVIENLKDKEVVVKVLDALPIAKTDRVQVKDIVMIPEPTLRNIQHQNGVMQWDMLVPAKETKDIRIQFAVKYPKGETLVLS